MNSINKIHEVNLNILKEVDRVCKKNKVVYYLESGTLLGAVRHNGFIPWDDDIDLLVKREDLAKFIKACKKDLDTKYEIITPKDFNGHFFDFVPRIIVKDSQLRNTTAEDKFYGNMQNRIALDIFVLDSTSSNRLAQKIHVIKHKMVYGLAMGHRYKIDYSKYSLANKVFSGALAKTGKHISLNRIFSWQEKLAIKYNEKSTEDCMVSNYILKEIGYVFKKEWYKKADRVRFEDCELDCPVGWDNILKVLYGDYMKLPDEKDQVYAHMNDGELKVGL